MALYDHKQSVLVLNGYEITAFTDAADALSITESVDAGAYTIGANGKGVFVTNNNESGTLTIKLLQHSADNQYLSALRNQQRAAIKSFTPIEMYFKDTLNGDESVGQRGFFTSPVPLSRGNAHNDTTFVIAFEKLRSKLAAGILN